MPMMYYFTYSLLNKYLFNESHGVSGLLSGKSRDYLGGRGTGSFDLCVNLLDSLLSICGDQFPVLCPEMRFPSSMCLRIS